MDSRDNTSPVAIVGIGLRLPGGITSCDEFWDFLVNKKDARSEVPADRYNHHGFYSATPEPHSTATQNGYFLHDVNLKRFDAGFFSMSRAEVEALDPQQRLLLEVVWECMESAGQANWRGKDIGCYVGVFGEDWQELTTKDTLASGVYRVTGTSDFAVSNRVSYEYDLRGPSMTIRTACSSSLTALHEACMAVQAGHCSGAIVGGTSLIMSPTMTIAMSEHGVLSPDGKCKTFDASANGYARAEAVNAIYIKPLRDAMKDGDPIRAVIRGTGTNSDGRTPGMFVPSQESQQDLMWNTYRTAGIQDLSRTAFVECHGTGTNTGDPAEAKAVANVFKGSEIFIGSVKPNIGHSEGASGISSVIKAVLTLENAVIPPNIHFNTPNPLIPFAERGLRVPTEPTPWPTDKDARVSVNSFGIGGANAHAILDSAATWAKPRPHTLRSLSTSRPRLLVFSANCADSLDRRISSTERFFEGSPIDLSSVAYTLSARRDHLSERAFCVTDGQEEWTVSPSQTVPQSAPQAVFVFTGQGAQWRGMAKELMVDFEVFSRSVHLLDQALKGLETPPEWSLAELIDTPSAVNPDDAEYSQPMCTAIQVGLVDLLASWGVNPSQVVGHSSGEIAAAYAAGALSAGQAIITAYLRGQVVNQQNTQARGAMAAVGLGRHLVLPHLKQGVVVACDNGPESVTLSGDENVLNDVLKSILRDWPEAFTRKLNVNKAYHSHHMADVGPTYERWLQLYLSPQKPKRPFYSTVTGAALSGEDRIDANYWRRNLEYPVLFYQATKTILEDSNPHGIFLEIGPHSALASFIRGISQEVSQRLPTYVATMVRNRDSTLSILETAGNLYKHGLNVSLSSINRPGEVLSNLPSYPWQHDTELWKQTQAVENWRLREYPHHELLGSPLLGTTTKQRLWRNSMLVENVPWLVGHKVHRDIVFPCAGYIAMAGEAVRQIDKSAKYLIEDLMITAPLTLQSGRATEIVTMVQPARLTDSLDSSWYEWSISSYSGSSWRKHCSGKVRPADEQHESPKAIHPFRRRVPWSWWYHIMQKIGLNYGGDFRGMRDISTDPAKPVAAAQFDQPAEESRTASFYAIHPCAIDACLQLFTVASTNGVPRRLKSLSLPTSIGRVQVGPAGATIQGEATAHSTVTGGISGAVTAISNKADVLSIQDATFKPLVLGDGNTGRDEFSVARLEWRPDLCLLQEPNIFPLADSQREGLLKLERYCCLLILNLVGSLPKVDGYLSQFASWVTHQYERITIGQWDIFVPEAAEYSKMTSSQRKTALVTLDRQFDAMSGDLASTRQLLRSVSSHAADVFAGTISPIDFLVGEGHLPAIYNLTTGRVACETLLRTLGHSQPNLRVLEIGAGTGGLTSRVLKALTTLSGMRTYSQYTFTDISSGFFPSARQRFEGYSAIEYRTLDISKDPIEQGFGPESFDLIIASNVIHVTRSVRDSLSNIRKLLRPGGRLWLQELAVEMRFIHFIMGILPGWWLGSNDNRADGPILRRAGWEAELTACGISQIEAFDEDDAQPYQTNSNILARVPVRCPSPSAVTILFGSEDPFVHTLRDHLTERGFKVDLQLWTDGMPVPRCPMIATMDLYQPFFENISAEQFVGFQKFVAEAKSKLLWLTGACQLTCQDPAYGLTIGIARTARTELGAEFATMELDTIEPSAVYRTVDVFEHICSEQTRVDCSPDYEFALVDGIVYTGRYHWSSVNTELSRQDTDSLSKHLMIERYGNLDSLVWCAKDRDSLGPDEVEVDIHVSGLNFKDTLVAMGIVDGARAGLGLEASGVVVRAGSNVSHVQVGDRVCMIGEGTFATRKVTLGDLCIRLPDSMSLEEAVTMPIAYATVVEALVEMGRLENGKSVLIHSACGGVGLAAIQLCLSFGAKIFATVGSREKVDYLVERFNIPRAHIFHSRDASFREGLMRETRGHGVDIALNALSGELLHATWQSVAEFGTMIEIGKRDLLGRGLLPMDPFLGNRSFCSLDLGNMVQKRPRQIKRLLAQCMRYYEEGRILPLPVCERFSARDIVGVFRTIQKGQHIGKMVINMDVDHAPITNIASSTAPAFSPSATYLLVGGMGGLGRSVAIWMAEHGARHFVFLSRSAGQSEDSKNLAGDLEAQECTVKLITGSAAAMEDVRNAVNGAPTEIRGVINMAMVLRDVRLTRMTHEDWNTVLAPKVEGTKNLHRALDGRSSLDFFVLFSSFSAVIGHHGQGNYNAANNFLNSFVLFRHGLGLPASVINLGPVEDVGYLTENRTVLNHLRSEGAGFIDEQDVLDALQIAILNSTVLSTSPEPESGLVDRGQLTVGLVPGRDSTGSVISDGWYRDIRMAIYGNMNNSQAASNAEVHVKGDEQLRGAELRSSSTSVIERIEGVVKSALSSLLLIPESNLSPNTVLTDIGVDSMVSIEIRNWWKSAFGGEVSVFEIMDSRTVEGLVKMALDKLQQNGDSTD